MLVHIDIEYVKYGKKIKDFLYVISRKVNLGYRFGSSEVFRRCPLNE